MSTKVIIPSRARHESRLADEPGEPVITTRATGRVIDPEIRGQMAEWIERNSFTRAEAGRALGFPDATAVSKYLNDRYDRDPAQIEARFREVLAAEKRSRHFGGKVIKTNVVEKFAVFVDRIRQTSACGVFSGEAGIGKTVAISDYIQANPTAVAITANAFQNDARGVKQLLFAATYVPPKFSGNHYDFLVSAYKGTGRPIIVDNAQRLGSGGRSLLFDLHDATGCPLIFVGNPEILAQVARNDQQHSRVPKHVDAALKDPRRVARAMITQHIENPDEVIDLALAVVSKPFGGHLRALAHLLADMRVLMELPANANDARGCFLKALAASIDHKALSSDDHTGLPS